MDEEPIRDLTPGWIDYEIACRLNLARENSRGETPEWTKDAGAALNLCVDVMQRAEREWDVFLRHMPGNRWRAAFMESWNSVHIGYGDTLALALCRAALVALREKAEAAEEAAE